MGNNAASEQKHAKIMVGLYSKSLKKKVRKDIPTLTGQNQEFPKIILYTQFKKKKIYIYIYIYIGVRYVQKQVKKATCVSLRERN